MFYQIFMTIGLSGIILFGFLSYLLQILFPLKVPSRKWGYVICSTLIYAVVYNIPHLFHLFRPHSDQTFAPIPFWYYFISTLVLSVLFSHLMLQGEFLSKLLYILFFVSFIQEYKTVCSPLYEHIAEIDSTTYQLLDLATFLLLCFMLFLLSLLFRRMKISSSLKNLPNKTFLIFYFPISFLAVYIVVFGDYSLQKYFPPLISIIIMSTFPIIYYFFAGIIQSYEEQKRLDKALLQTQAQLEQYRFSMEIQERIRRERHELRNNYFYIQALLTEKSYSKLEDYLEQVIGSKMEAINEISSGNTLMDYILNKKIQEARTLGIKTYTEILVPEHLPISDDRLCTILLNLLDNAMEASKNETEPDMHILIRCSGNYLTCRILNKTSKNILADNPELHTTKENPEEHGLGIRIIQETVESLNGMIHYSMEGEYFCASLMLPLQ